MSIRSRHPNPPGAGRRGAAGRGGWAERPGGPGWLVIVAMAAGLLLVGCAGSPTERGSASGGTASTVGPSSSTGPSAPPSSTPSPSTSGSGAGQVVVRGTVRDGVEPGCLLLDGQDKHVYLLLDAGNGDLRAGARVEVVGQPVDQVASFCGEGSALAVVSVKPLK